MVLAQARKFKKDLLDKEEAEVNRQKTQLEEYAKKGDMIKDKIDELQDLIRNPEGDKDMKVVARATIPKLQAELNQIAAGLPKRQAVFDTLEGAFLVSRGWNLA